MSLSSLKRRPRVRLTLIFYFNGVARISVVCRVFSRVSISYRPSRQQRYALAQNAVLVSLPHRTPGAANLWGAVNGNVGLRTLADLVEVGYARGIFTDAEVLTLAASEEKYYRLSKSRPHEQPDMAIANSDDAGATRSGAMSHMDLEAEVGQGSDGPTEGQVMLRQDERWHTPFS